MAITFGTPTNSGNKTASSSFSWSHTVTSSAKCLVVVVTGIDSSATDSVVLSVSWDNQTMTQIAGGRYRVGNDFQDIWYLPLPFALTSVVGVQLNGSCTDVQATAIELVDNSADVIIYDSYDTGTGSGSATSVINPARTGSVAVGGGVALGGAPASLSVTAGTEISGSEVDMGNQTASCATATESGGTTTITWSYTGQTCTALSASFYSQTFPVTTLSSPANAGTTSDTTPDLVFSATDAESDTSHFQVKVVNPSIASFDLKYVDWYMTKTGSPTGNLYCIVYSDITLKKKIGTSDAKAETGIFAGYNRFTFASTIPLVSGQTYYIGLGRSVDDNVNYCWVYYASSNPYPDGTSFTFPGPTESAVNDFRFKLLDSTTTVQLENTTGGLGYALLAKSELQFCQEVTLGTVIINHNSQVNSSNFSGTPPYSSGASVTYTVPAGTPLTVGQTYYWNVRGSGILRANPEYALFSSPYSFTVSAGTPTNVLQMCIES